MSEKLQKVLARAGFGSRRELERWIEAGRVKVNGQIATVGDRVNDSDKVTVDGKRLAPQQKTPRGGPRKADFTQKLMGKQTAAGFI